MTAPIDFYFDFSSPYGYIASEKIDELAARHGRTVLWHPILLGVAFKATGAAPLPSIPLKGEYAMNDIARSARFYGLPYRQPTQFPIPTQHAARGFLWLADRNPQLAGDFARACYRAYFVDDRNLAEPDVLRAIATSLGVDAAEFGTAVNDPEFKERLKAEVELAMARGVFGSPYFFVDGEAFWGADRLPQIERWLAEGGF